MKQCWRFCLEDSVRVVWKKARNAKKAARKILRREGLGRRVPSGSAESLLVK